MKNVWILNECSKAISIISWDDKWVDNVVFEVFTLFSLFSSPFPSVLAVLCFTFCSFLSYIHVHARPHPSSYRCEKARWFRAMFRVMLQHFVATTKVIISNMNVCEYILCWLSSISHHREKVSNGRVNSNKTALLIRKSDCSSTHVLCLACSFGCLSCALIASQTRCEKWLHCCLVDVQSVRRSRLINFLLLLGERDYFMGFMGRGGEEKKKDWDEERRSYVNMELFLSRQTHSCDIFFLFACFSMWSRDCHEMLENYTFNLSESGFYDYRCLIMNYFSQCQ